MIYQYPPYQQAEKKDVFGIALGFMIVLFLLLMVFFIANYMVGGLIYPMMKALTATESFPGIVSILEKLNNGWYWALLIIIAIPFVWVSQKLLYRKEETTLGGM